jgi:site-specific DNA-cytosine methylase
MMHSSIEEARFEEVKKPVGLLVAGIPCEPYSRIRRNDGDNVKVDKKLAPEAHELGDMAFWCLRAVDILNPHTVILEEVPEFLTSGAGCIVQHALRRMGYTVDTRIINAADHGDITRRTRAVIVGTAFDSVDWPDPTPTTAVLSSALLPADDPGCEWFTRVTESKSWLFDHWDKQKAKGNNLVSAIVSYSDASIGTIKKRYLAGQGDNQVVIHPEDENKPEATRRYRWLTVLEIKRIMGLPDDYYVGDTKTLAGEGLGQGVAVRTFTKLIAAVTRTA